MITQQCSFLDFLARENDRFTIPFYQRSYTWTPRQCAELWEDLQRAGVQQRSHYMSMIIFRPAELLPDGTVVHDVIDGQQRIATLTILLTALVEHLRETATCVGGLSADEMEANYVLGGAHDVQGKRPSKLQLLQADDDCLQALIDGQEAPSASRVGKNFAYFHNAMAQADFDANTLWRGLQQLLIISVQLSETDNAQAIFESLNVKGLPLSTADLVRNYLLVAETREEQQRLYAEYWNPIQLMFGEDKSSLKLNAGIRMWLTIRFQKQRIRDKSQTYTVFKNYMTQEFDGTTEDLLDELRSFCLMWAENYKFNEVKEFRGMDWAKRGQNKTLLPGWGHQSGF
ncbi:MAG: DUF262 domain-containing protein [Coriobacteriia bacterium]|nr:DUF262 domain-containing protein [Coriobacteriia bacterium]